MVTFSCDFVFQFGIVTDCEQFLFYKMAYCNKSNRVPSSVSKVFDLSQEFRDFSNTLSILPKNKRCYVKQMMESLGFGEANLDELEVKFSPNQFLWSHFQAGNTDKKRLPISGFESDFKLYEIPKDTKLKSLKALHHSGNDNSKKSRSLKRKLRYTGQVNITNFPELDDDKGKDKLKEDSDYIITVQVYQPGTFAAFKFPRRSKPIQVSHELLVYGNQTLDQLRDRILCPEDLTPAEGDVSNNPFQVSMINNDGVFRSAMFFINNTFYIDGRYPGCIDYSEVVKRWAKDKKLDLYATEQMEQTKFSSIKFRLGYPYLYKHQGSCEHLIIFTDARLVSPGDLLVKSAYPLLKSYASLRGKHCMVCSARIAKFIVIGTQKLPNNKSYICGICLHQYLYIDGEKVDDFTVYKYIDHVAIF